MSPCRGCHDPRYAAAQKNLGDALAAVPATAPTTAAASTGTTTMSNIAVSTDSGTGISLTHGGTVNVTGTGNTINSASGTALDITNTDIGSSGVTFKSISDGTGSGSSGDGIILDNTGASSGLTVTGDGSTAGSGGTIENKTGSSDTSGTGIYLNETADVSIAYMQLNGLAFDGIYATTVTNFSMDHTVVNGANGSAVGEGSVIFGSGQHRDFRRRLDHHRYVQLRRADADDDGRQRHRGWRRSPARTRHRCRSA